MGARRARSPWSLLIDKRARAKQCIGITNKIHIKQKLKRNSSVLKKYHASRIGLSGSTVRDAHNDGSDVDLVADFSEAIFFEYVHLSDDLPAS
ncbi:MAG TPA: nucleotidyltransferase domain-containing protein [Spirochaetota bacterium]|nr:nucleotidyltransferase domain-containing protein [Spirochaetota bacterium]